MGPYVQRSSTEQSVVKYKEKITHVEVHCRRTVVKVSGVGAEIPTHPSSSREENFQWLNSLRSHQPKSMSLKQKRWEALRQNICAVMSCVHVVGLHDLVVVQLTNHGLGDPIVFSAAVVDGFRALVFYANVVDEGQRSFLWPEA